VNDGLIRDMGLTTLATGVATASDQPDDLCAVGHPLTVTLGLLTPAQATFQTMTYSDNGMRATSADGRVAVPTAVTWPASSSTPEPEIAPKGRWQDSFGGGGCAQEGAQRDAGKLAPRRAPPPAPTRTPDGGSNPECLGAGVPASSSSPARLRARRRHGANSVVEGASFAGLWAPISAHGGQVRA
jgi:hypothetical protein